MREVSTGTLLLQGCEINMYQAMVEMKVLCQIAEPSGTLTLIQHETYSAFENVTLTRDTGTT